MLIGALPRESPKCKLSQWKNPLNEVGLNFRKCYCGSLHIQRFQTLKTLLFAGIWVSNFMGGLLESKRRSVVNFSHGYFLLCLTSETLSDKVPYV